MDYSVGLVRHWLEELLGGSSGDVPLSPCHERVFHGRFDQGGGRPTVALRRSKDGTVSFLEAHEGVSARSVDIGQCGRPIPFDGLVLDSFSVDQWIDAVYPLDRSHTPK